MENQVPSFTKTRIICWFIGVAALYAFSFTLFLPVFLALSLSPWLRAKFFVIAFTIVTTAIRPLTEIREKLHEMIREQYPTRKALHILEIGVGNAPNLEYYPDNWTITMLDANPNFGKNIKDRLAKFPHVKVDKIIFAKAEDMKDVTSDDYDVVLCTHLLCSVSDVDAVLRESCRVLRKGGKFAFMDHVAFPEGHTVNCIQRLLGPLWKIYFNGCQLTRAPHRIMGRYFSNLDCRTTFVDDFPLVLIPHAYGVATK